MFIVRKTDYSNYTNDEVLIDFHVHDGPYPKKHKHGFYEIMVVLKGNCANMVNENEFRMSAMDASIQRPDDIHQILHCDTDSYTHINIEITAQLFEQMTNVVNTEFFTKVNEAPCLQPFRVAEDDLLTVKSLIYKAQLMRTDYVNGQNYIRRAAMTLILSAVDRGENLFSQKAGENDLVKEILSVMSRESSMPASLGEICRQIPISERQLNRLFHKNGLGTPAAVFREYKLDYAFGLLTTTNMSVINIMEKIGLWDVRNFNRLFKAQYGETPGRFRKLYSNKQNTSLKHID